jgi:hypothetical protein
MPAQRPFEQAFWSKVDKRDPDECWPWTGKRNSGGYARLCRGRSELSASQIAWRLANGRDFPAGLYALHRCDNPGCVNPAHIRPGTQRENVADMVAKGRANWTGLVVDQLRRGPINRGSSDPTSSTARKE